MVVAFIASSSGFSGPLNFSFPPCQICAAREVPTDMKTFYGVLGSVVLLSAVLAGCAAAPDDGTADRVDEVVDQTSSALMSSSGGTGLTGGQCTTCGCTLEQTSGPDGNGCRTYRCVCDSDAKAKCVLGKMSAVSAISAARVAP